MFFVETEQERLRPTKTSRYYVVLMENKDELEVCIINGGIPSDFHFAPRGRQESNIPERDSMFKLGGLP